MINNFNPTVLDYLFLLLTIFLAAHSFLKGFIHESLSIIVLISSAVIAYSMQKYLSLYLSSYISLAKLTSIVSYIISFIIAYLILGLIAQYINQRFQQKIGIMDRFLGLLFGCLKSFVIILIFYTLMDLIIPISHQPDFLNQSIMRELTSPLEKSLFSTITSGSKPSIPNINNISPALDPTNNPTAEKVINSAPNNL